MLVPALIVLVIVNSEQCSAIRVPSNWDDNSDLNKEQTHNEPIDIPQEYFQYTAKKPHFAIDVAKVHGVQNPESHYKAYPVRPFTGAKKPELGKHRILDGNRVVFKPYQEYVQTERPKKSTAIDYEVYHPYKEEIPALETIYKDPVLEKIRSDIEGSQYRLKEYETEAGKPNISKDEYLESVDQTDRKKLPQRNVPVPFEIHRPQRLPVYYRPPPKDSYREHVLNHRFRHPWNVNYGKIRPVHYRPLKNHLHRLRQHHALKYDDEKNEYPQLPPPEKYSEPSDGYDIYEHGKEKYVQLRNNVDEQINKAVRENRPTTYQKLELQKSNEHPTEEDEEEFIPVKNYAQVRKSETYKHLPRSAAFDDADNLDEIKNAPRLREAVKSTKAQTVYTEEGYEDAAYDHAGEQKHASENEGHAGYLKEKELSGGKFKTPSVSASYDDSKGQEYRDQLQHGDKWKTNDKDNEKKSDSEDYSEDESEKSIEESILEALDDDKNKQSNEKISRSDDNPETSDSRETLDDSDTDSTDLKSIQSNSNESLQHEVNKRETTAKIPQIDLSSTFLTVDEIKNKSNTTLEPQKEFLKEKYPYYFNNLKNINKDSPLRYSENLKLIPKKSKGGTEFYDSRSIFECSEVDEEVNVLPDKFKKEGHPDSDESGDEDSNTKENGQPKNHHRLKGLGDKIDCFKAKYFGENPLDSPFFKEELISNPEPVTLPNLPAYRLNGMDASVAESIFSNVYNTSHNLKDKVNQDVNSLINSLKSGQQSLQDSLVKSNEKLKESLTPQIISNINNSKETSINTDDEQGYAMKSIFINPFLSNNYKQLSGALTPTLPRNTGQANITYSSFQNKEDIVKPEAVVRKKRASFVYEPYKTIRDGQVQESKKTTTTGNISPLIKQLQSRGVNLSSQPVKRNVPSKMYVDIGKKERERAMDKGAEEIVNGSFIDVSIDKRRGEPRYELKHANHKPLYTPVKNKISMSIEDYKAQTNQANETQNNVTNTITHANQNKTNDLIRRRPTVKPYFDISQFLPKPPDQNEQRPSASNTVKKVIRSKSSEKETKGVTTESSTVNDDESDEEYDEYDNDDEEEEEETTTTTTTTATPVVRRRLIKTTTTTASPEEETEIPKLRLVTRFHVAPTTTKKPNRINKNIEHSNKKNQRNEEDVTPQPKYREKKKKTSESTLVTDTKSYGEDNDDDMKKEEVDALIRVQQDMDEYTPQYEKQKSQSNNEGDQSSYSEEKDSDEYDEDENDDEDDEEEDDDEDSEEDTEEDIKESQSEKETPKTTVTTTPEPTKRTLVRTTEAPISTTEARSAKIQQNPIVLKKKIEIHKELPVSKSSPHKSQFKQDIKQVEIIKESIPKPRRKPVKNVEALELYRDDKLAEEINKLGAVEVFKQNLDLNTGPKHGGNYRRATETVPKEQESTTQRSYRVGKARKIKDAETSESESTRLVELSDTLPAIRKHGGHLKSILKIRSKDDNDKKYELSDERHKISNNAMHGGNLRANIQENKSGKLIELHEDPDNDYEDQKMHGGNFKSYDSNDDAPIHKSNYRNAKLVEDDKERIGRREESKGRYKAAGLLNSFAQAVPILTTTPAYILDPSKRMYYYVDT